MARHYRSRQQRGYGADHERRRKVWAQRIANNQQPPCTRCGWPILPTDQWDLDHTDDRHAYLGPAHAHCNRHAGQAKGMAHRLVRHKATPNRPTSTNW